MLNNEAESLIKEVVELYSTSPLTQQIIDDGVEKLKIAKTLLVPPANPLVCNTVAEMKKQDFKIGDIVTTLGYDNVGDNGNAKYEIMDYETWWVNLPDHVKFVHYHNDRIGCNPVLYRNPVDCYINHILDNGLVASLIKENNTIRVEQGGCIEGRTDNCRALRHIFAYNNTGVIEFGKDKKYELYYDSHNQCFDRESEIIPEKPWWLGKTGVNGNEYALILGCRVTTKPCLGRVKDLKLVGNNCTIHIPDNEFCMGGSDFAMFESGGIINGLEITGFNFDCNGLNQVGYYTETINEDGTVTKKFNSMRTCNHTISYFSSGIGEKALSVSPVVDKYGIPHEDLCISLLGDTEFSNVNIHHNNFYSNGTIVDTSDGGGDHVLIINPTKSENVFIEDNYFENWGRWVFAVDLGGNGERFYNYKFNRNTCIQNEDNYIPRANGSKLYRGLGFIDFEARKCFTNLEVCDNYVVGANGWAFNGNGKISENITIKNNRLERPSRAWRSIYPYSFTFYSVHAKDLVFENNEINYGSIGLGRTIYNLSMKNNTFGETGTIGLNVTGDCIIENNTGNGTRSQLFALSSTYSDWVNNELFEWYIPKELRETNIVFRNNGNGGICGDLINPDDLTYYSNHTLIFEGNHFAKFNCNCWGLKKYVFDVSQLNSEITFSARGCSTTSPTYSMSVNNPIVGGFQFKKGDLVTTNNNVISRYHGIADFYVNVLGYSRQELAKKKLYCSQDGYFPTDGEFLMCNADIIFGKEAIRKCDKTGYYVTRDNLYYCVQSGTTDHIPTHVEGKEVNGTAILLYLCPVGRLELRD